MGWYALAALAGIEGVWLGVLAVRSAELARDLRALEGLLTRSEDRELQRIEDSDQTRPAGR